MENKTTIFFKKISRILYFMGFPNFWTEESQHLDKFEKAHKIICKMQNILVYILIVMEFSAFYTQNDLKEKQMNDRITYSYAHLFLYIIPVDLSYHRAQVTKVLHDLAIGLKALHNDETIEKSSLFKSRLYCFAFGSACFMTMFTAGVDGFMDYKHGENFVTVITAWPDVKDKSIEAHTFRIIAYICWWILMNKVVTGYILVITLTTCLNHQFRNLASYFEGLNNIFLIDTSTQGEKDKSYEKALKVGIKLHTENIRCAGEISTITSKAYAAHIMVYLLVLAFLMAQLLKSERRLADILRIVSGVIALTIVTGFLMWSAGDVTVQALNVSSSIYLSGWENCERTSSVRVRQLVVVAMIQAQQPLVFKTLGVLELSYESYVSIVKASYSVFSLLK